MNTVRPWQLEHRVGRRQVLAGLGAAIASTLLGCSNAPTGAPSGAAPSAIAPTAVPSGSAPPVSTPSAAQATQTSAASTVFRLGHSGADAWQGNIWATTFAKELESRAPSVKVQVFPNAQLGQDPALAEAVKLGTLDMTVNGPTLEQYVPGLAVFDLPFLFKKSDDAHAAQDGSVGQKISSAFDAQGFHFLGWVDIGVRDVTNNRKPINTAADLKGMKIRVPPGKIYLATFQALGASVQSIDFGELYTALQQGVVDGEENPPTTVRVQKYYEVQKYMSLTRHIMAFAYAAMNRAIYQKQPEPVRTAIDQAASAATKAVREFMVTDEQKSLDFLKQQGMQINEPTDPSSFQKATQSVIDGADPEVAALAKEIMK